MKAKQIALTVITGSALLLIGAGAIMTTDISGQHFFAEQSQNYPCFLSWTDANKVVNGLSRSSTVELTYGTAITTNKGEHVGLKTNGGEQAFVKTSGVAYDASKKIGGQVNGLQDLLISATRGVANDSKLVVTFWNTATPDTTKTVDVTFTDKKAEVTIDARAYNANQFKIAVAGTASDDVISIKSISVGCTTKIETNTHKLTIVDEFATFDGNKKEVSLKDGAALPTISETRPSYKIFGYYNTDNPNQKFTLDSFKMGNKDMRITPIYEPDFYHAYNSKTKKPGGINFFSSTTSNEYNQVKPFNSGGNKGTFGGMNGKYNEYKKSHGEAFVEHNNFATRALMCAWDGAKTPRVENNSAFVIMADHFSHNTDSGNCTVTLRFQNYTTVGYTFKTALASKSGDPSQDVATTEITLGAYGSDTDFAEVTLPMKGVRNANLLIRNAFPNGVDTQHFKLAVSGYSTNNE